MNSVKRLIRSIHLFQKDPNLYQDYERVANLLKCQFLKTFPPGHFYSPVPDLGNILSQQTYISEQSTKELLGIDFREQKQLGMLSCFAAYYDDLPFPEEQTESNRFYYKNAFFSYSDAIVLYSILRHFQPNRVIEVGSGFSSAIMLDTNDLFLNKKTHFVFIEPYPERLYTLLTNEDRQRYSVIEQPVQNVDLKLFEALGANDILFIDSSHVAKVGSDVLHIIFEILPRLNKGVIIHFHDIFHCFEYPREWFEEGRAWNESYFLRAFLQYNLTFKILYFNSFMGKYYSDLLRQKMPLCFQNTGGSLWLEKVE